MKRRTQGFSLMELMVVLAIAGTILAIGAPSFGEFSRNNRITAAANDFLGGVQVARTEAIKRQLLLGAVSVCPTDNPEAASPTCLADATRKFDGWIVFADTNNDCDRQATEKVLRAGTRIDTDNNDTRFLKSSADGACVTFLGTGFTRADGPRKAASHILYCDDRGTDLQKGTDFSTARGIEITQTGRARITRDKTEIEGWDVSCAQ